MNNIVCFCTFYSFRKVMHLTHSDIDMISVLPAPQRIGFATIALANIHTQNITYIDLPDRRRA